MFHDQESDQATWSPMTGKIYKAVCAYYQTYTVYRWSEPLKQPCQVVISHKYALMLSMDQENHAKMLFWRYIKSKQRLKQTPRPVFDLTELTNTGRVLRTWPSPGFATQMSIGSAQAHS